MCVRGEKVRVREGLHSCMERALITYMAWMKDNIERSIMMGLACDI